MDNSKKKSLSRRDFVRNATALGAAAIVSTIGLSEGYAQNLTINSKPELEEMPTGIWNKNDKPMIGIQAGVATLAKMGIGPFLDDIQKRGAVNTLFLFSFTYIPKRTGIEFPNFHGGNFATVHPEYYKDIQMKPENLRSPDFGDIDFIAKIIPEAKKRGIRVFPWVLEDSRRPTYIVGMEQLYEIDLYGRRATGHPAGPCYNNPYYRNLMLGTLEDYTRSYEIDGLMWGAERQGPMSNALGAYHNGASSDPGAVTCFCKFCTEKGKQQGIDVDRVKKGFLSLEQFVKAGRIGKRPRDGYYVDFWRMILNYPEILIWHSFWTNSMREFQQELYKKVKSIKPEVQMGFHIWHNTSFNPIFRADQDYELYKGFSDYIKPVLYSNSAGERMSEYIDSVGQNINGDLSKKELLEFEYRVLNYQEKSYDKLTTSGFSSDYVLRETKRAKEAIACSKTLLWTGVGIDEPSISGSSTPESVRKDIIASFKGGADGVLLSRYYSEMKPENLSSAGDTIRELGLA